MSVSAERGLAMDVHAIRDSLAVRRRIGAAPWESQRFKFVGAIATDDASHVMAMPGRDFDVPQSPEATLDWLIGTGRLERLSEAQREAGIAELAAITQERRRRVTDIHAQIARLSQARPTYRGRVAFLVEDNAVYLGRPDDVPEVREVLDALARFDASLIRAADDLMPPRQGR